MRSTDSWIPLVFCRRVVLALGHSSQRSAALSWPRYSNRSFRWTIIALAASALLFVAGCKRSPAPPMSHSFEYDDAGRIAGRIDGEGRRVRYAYDAAGRLADLRYPDGTVRLRYDANGDLVSMADGNRRQEYAYDPFGRLTEAAFLKYGPERRVAYGYDPWGRVALMCGCQPPVKPA